MFLLSGCSKYKDDELRSCSVSTGGGMLGGCSQASLRINKDGSATYAVSQKETHADREVTTVYSADPHALERVREIVNEYDLYAASKRKYSDMQVMDGETTSISFTYSTGSFRISENQILSAKMREGFREFISYMNSLAQGEGVTTVEAQTATLYLRSGYTLRFIVEDVFDGRLDGILSEEREVSSFGESGIILRAADSLDVSGAEPVQSAGAGTIVYDGGSGGIIILYKDYDFGHGVYILARLDDYIDSACPLIEQMEGPYRLYLN